MKDYAFIHYAEREHAVKALEAMNNAELDGLTLEVSLAKPQPSQKDRRRGGQSGYGAYGGPRGGPRGGPSGRGRGGHYGGDRDGYYGGYDQGYDDYYGGGGYGGGYREDYGGNNYDDYYYQRPPQPRGGGPPRGGRGGPRGGPGRGGYSGRGGDRGGRGGAPRGRGGRGGPLGRGGPRGGGVAPGKRKYGADSMQAPVEYPEPKRRFMGQNQGGGWGSQPIAQQPLYDNSGYGSQSNQEWYSDSYGQQW